MHGNSDFMADNVPYTHASIRTILFLKKPFINVCHFFYFLLNSNAKVEQNVDSGIY